MKNKPELQQAISLSPNNTTQFVVLTGFMNITNVDLELYPNNKANI